MKIGILSMQRIVNYGSFLQAYGLKKTVEKLGHEVEFVDYTIEPCLVKKPQQTTNILKKSKKVCKELCKGVLKSGRVLFLKRKWETFEKFESDYENKYLPILGITEKRNISPEVDCLIIGSDEVFNCLQTNKNVGYSRELFGINCNAKEIISYAASFGNATLEGLKKYRVDQEIAEGLKKFESISVRDQNSQDIVKELTARIADMHLDPVLIYDFKEIDSIKTDYNYAEKYMVVYAYPGRINKKEGKKIREFARKKKCRLIGISGSFWFCDDSVFPSPFEVLRLFRGAEYRVTDTFHGSVFSIKYNKQFAVFVRDGEELKYGNSQKITDLLDKFKLQDRIISSDSVLEEVIDQPIDYNRVNDKIIMEKQRTNEYLEKLLKE